MACSTVQQGCACVACVCAHSFCFCFCYCTASRVSALLLLLLLQALNVYRTYVNMMNAHIRARAAADRANPFDFRHISYLKVCV